MTDKDRKTEIIVTAVTLGAITAVLWQVTKFLCKMDIDRTGRS